MGELLARKINRFYTSTHQKPPELIIPIPLHKKRLQERGFNQALEMAKIISKKLKITIDYSSCIRIKNTQAQSLLSSKNRQTNLKQAFTLIKPITANHIAILDDVITTGHTIQEFLSILPLHVKKIDIWCCASTQLAL